LGQPPTAQALLPAAHFGAARPKIAGMDMGELKSLAFCEVLEMDLGAHVVSGMVRQFTAWRAIAIATVISKRRIATYGIDDKDKFMEFVSREMGVYNCQQL
jgi:hypothetical protein